MSDYILEMVNITKEFPGVKALDQVTFRVKQGEIHALAGENGAGKSTLMKVLSGVYPHGTYSGDIVLKDQIQSYQGIKDSEKAGVAIIYQELTLVRQMNVCENIFLGNELVEHGIINWDKSFAETERVLKEVKMDVNPATRVFHLGVGQQQLIEIAKAIAKRAQVLILDEPTAALTEKESEHLLSILRELKAKGVTCIYISHKLNEILSIADTVTILRDGKTICTEAIQTMTEDKIIARMVGRELTERFPYRPHAIGDVIMEVKDWSVPHPEIPNKLLIKQVSFEVKKGEILGIAGLMGSGRTELMMSLFGAFSTKGAGFLAMHGKPVRFRNPQEAIRHGFCYLSEDRKQYGLVLGMDIKQNTTLASLDKIASHYIINTNEEIRVSERYVKELRTKTPSVEQKTGNLSGGNQQKVVLAKWLMATPVVLVLDEPTRGIDVGAKFEIYNIMNGLVEQGVSIIMISSELPEVLGMSDRVLVMHEGKINGEMSREAASQEKVMFYATGGI